MDGPVLAIGTYPPNLRRAQTESRPRTQRVSAKPSLDAVEHGGTMFTVRFECSRSADTGVHAGPISARLREVGHRATLLAWPNPSRIRRRVSKRSPLTRRSITSNRSGATLSTNPICRSQTGSASFSKNGLRPTAPIPLPADLGARFVLNSSASSPHRANRAQPHRSTTCATRHR